MSVWIICKIHTLRLASFLIFFTYFLFMYSLHCSKSESSNGGRISFLTCLSILPLEIWPKRQYHNFDNASWALLCHLFQSNTLSPAALSAGVACLWRASELTLYSIEVLGDRVTLWDWAHNCRLNHVLYHSQIFFVGSDPLPMLKVIGHLMGFKIPLSSCPSGINLVCLPHRWKVLMARGGWIA